MIRRLPNLFTAHIDAWGTTFLIGMTCLLLHGASAWLLVIAVTVGYWLGFAVNDYYDAPVDRLDPRKAARGFFTAVTISPTSARLIFAGIAALLLPVFTGYGLRGLIVFGVALIVLWAYSAPPLRLKSAPGFDLITHALFVQTFPYLIPMFLLRLAWTPLDLMLIAACALASSAAQLEQQARDYEIDRLVEQNFTTWIGRERALRLMRLLTLALIALLVVGFVSGVIPAFLMPFALACLPLALHRFARRADQPRSEWLFRVTIVVALGYGALILLFR